MNVVIDQALPAELVVAGEHLVGSLEVHGLARIIPGLSANQLAQAVNRWCFMLGSATSLDEVDRGTFADFHAGLGPDFGGSSVLR